jgi:hypothetical protein
MPGRRRIIVNFPSVEMYEYLKQQFVLLKAIPEDGPSLRNPPLSPL